jgi:hypothetical protein
MVTPLGTVISVHEAPVVPVVPVVEVDVVPVVEVEVVPVVLVDVVEVDVVPVVEVEVAPVVLVDVVEVDVVPVVEVDVVPVVDVEVVLVPVVELALLALELPLVDPALELDAALPEVLLVVLGPLVAVPWPVIWHFPITQDSTAVHATHAAPLTPQLEGLAAWQAPSASQQPLHVSGPHCGVLPQPPSATATATIASVFFMGFSGVLA